MNCQDKTVLAVHFILGLAYLPELGEMTHETAHFMGGGVFVLCVILCPSLHKGLKKPLLCPDTKQTLIHPQGLVSGVTLAYGMSQVLFPS